MRFWAKKIFENKTCIFSFLIHINVKMKKLIRPFLLILSNPVITIATFFHQYKIYSHETQKGSVLRGHFNGTTL